MRELVTAKEAAKRLGVHSKTIERAMKTGIYLTEAPNKRKYLIWDTDKLVRSADGRKGV